ncbi:Multidrug resistance protein 3 [Colletotrichum spinosum]|uniref:Multidrug resistance protein 3 n=1 Tax=Colletotrichum spinosum TaxID=1347390 RepID=A0A4R8Q1J4_9PEZI|nr:Multidrug resistance protein 3 [Colletotrichum spinosum]
MHPRQSIAHRAADQGRSLSYPNLSLGETAGFASANSIVHGSRRDSTITQPENPAKQILIICSLLLGLLLSTLDTSVVATSLITISEELQDHANAAWIILVYLLTYMGCSVLMSKLSDIYGRRTMLFCSWSTFLAFSVGCTASTSMKALIVCRAFQGIGGAGLYSLTQICLLEHGPAHKPGLMGALIGATLAVAFLLGPILGGAITSKVSWRWVFAVNIPAGLVAMVCILACFPREYRSHNILSRRSFGKIDWLGMLQLLAASVLLVFAIEKGGTRVYSWHHPLIIFAFVTSALLWTTFALWETYMNTAYCVLLDHHECSHMEPVFTARLARRRPYMCGLIVSLLTGAPHVALTIVIPEHMQVMERENPFNAGLHLLPMLAGCATGSFVAGAFCRHHNYTSILMLVSAATQLLGLGLMLTLGSSFAPAYGYTLVIDLGIGVSFGATTMVAAVETESTNDMAVAQGAIAQARVLGSCVGVAICTVLFNNRLDSLIQHLDPQQLATLQQTPTVSSGWSEDIWLRVKEVYAVAFKDQTTFLMAVCALMLVTAAFSWETAPKPISSLGRARQAHKNSALQTERENDGAELSDLASVRSA